MGQVATRLHGKKKVIGDTFPPFRKGLLARKTVETIVDLNGVQLGCIIGEPLFLRKTGGIEIVFPMSVLPTGASHPDRSLFHRLLPPQSFFSIRTGFSRTASR